MSKAKLIRDLDDIGLTTREIAGLLNCRIEYVRVCARQRRNNKGVSPADLKYMQKLGVSSNYEAYCQLLAKRYGMDDPKAAWARYARERRARTRESAA